MNYQFIKLALALFFSAGFLFIPNKALTSPDHVVINEIQITGGTGHTTDDFVELFNPNNTPFNLKGHRLVKRTATGTTDTSIKSWTGDTLVPAYGFYLWANSGYSAISTTPDATTSESLADNNGIALRQGATDTGTIIDSLAWGTATNTFVEGAAYPDNPAASQSLERKRPETGSRQDTTNNSQDFSLQTSPSPQNTQSAVENITVATPGTTIYIPLPLAPATPEPGEVVINELVNDPSDGEEEWVELYNRTNHIINLSDWTLADGSKSITALDGSLGTDSTGRYLVIKSLKGNLNNDGDSVVLKYSETIIDQVTYGKWDDGSISNNGPVAPRGASLGRSPDGADSNRDEVDFFILEPTPGTANQLPADTAKLKSNSDPRISIAFNELYPNPPLGDEIEEYIELINLGSSAVDLKGWVLADEDTSYTINSNDWLATVIEPGKIWLLPRPKTKIALDNEGTEHLKLSSVDGKIKITLTYEGPAKPGVTYSRNDKSEWQWSTTPTPGTTNTITIINQPPQPVLYAPPAGQAGELIMFDASDSIDPEGETLSFSWSFGDGGTSETPTPSHIYTALRRYTVRLVVRDAVGN
ncbi:MAG: lamin tail domain-containing protein [Candidatus Kerfeldbacteria bacterium]|nr:lamin tail domain-containing protein [Candidatus Kerfeldbacteria bacterium]